MFVWGFAYEKSNGLIPGDRALGMYSGLTLAGTYVVARIVRMTNVMRLVSGNRKIAIVLVSLCLIIVPLAHVGSYNSPFSVVLAMGAFVAFSKIEMSRAVSRVIVFSAKSMFSVYFLHYIGVSWFKAANLASLLCGATMIFVLAIFADMPRRFLVAVMYPFVKRGGELIDQTYGRLLSCIACYLEG